MTLEPPPRCSALAEELDEPMIGTTDERRRWLLVEDRSAWGHDAVGDVLGQEMKRLAAERKIRLLLVRRREGDPGDDAVRRAILVDTGAARMAIRRLVDLAELTPALVADASLDEFGAPMADPIVLVCTNGKRDACCALRGRRLVAALAPDHAERTWECTHLGGHRFAANLVCLPDGIVYGRVMADDGSRLVADYLDGRIDPAVLRGRSAWPAPAQVAERAVRVALGLDGLGDLMLAGVESDETRASVALVGPDGRMHRLELAAERLAPRATSCGADVLEEPLHWRVIGFAGVGAT